MVNQYTALENKGFDQVMRNLSACLNTLQNRVILPGGEVFFFKDLMFNEEQDLVVTLTYKDNAPHALAVSPQSHKKVLVRHRERR